MALPEKIHQRGTRAAQPAPNLPTAAPGVLYCVTDEGNIVEVSTGGSWVPYSPSGAVPVITRSIVCVIDGGGAAITTGIKADVYVPYACTITAVTMLADQSGSIVVDIWNDILANYPPTVADTITGAAKPTISAATFSQNTTLTGWTLLIAAGSTLRFNVDSAATITRLHLALTVTS